MAGAQPLTGVRVIDLTTNMSGPFATLVLADQGADIVKVEALSGDVIRGVGSGRAGMSAYFANLNRGKRSLAVDLGTDAGRGVIERLAAQADVFVQNFRNGVIERLGLGADVLTAANPRLVYASISGFGPRGPLAEAPAYDHVVQAMSGFAALQSDGEQPGMVRQGVVDKATGYAAAQAVTAALVARASSGQGCRIDVSMLDVALSFLWPDGMMNHTCAEPDRELPPVSRSFRLTPTADGHVSLVTLTAAQWERLVDAVLDEGDTRPDLSDTGARMAGGAAVMRQVRAKVATLPTAEVVERLGAADVPCSPVVSLDDVPHHPQVEAAGSVATFEHRPLGTVTQARPAPRFDGERPPVTDWAPQLGEHTDEILADASFAPAEVADLRRSGVIA